MDKIFIKQVIERLKISRTTVYKHINILKIRTHKEGVKTYITQEQFDEIKNKVTTGLHNFTETKQLENTLRNEIKNLKKEKVLFNAELKISDNKNKNLELENAKLEGKLEILEIQNNKLYLISGGLSEQVKNLTLENQIPKKSKGIFTKIAKYFTNPSK